MALRGLQQAARAPQSFGIDPRQDPGGGALKQRSEAGAEQYLRNTPMDVQQYGPIGQNHWNALSGLYNSRFDTQGFTTLMQAVKESAPGGIATPSRRGDPLEGLPTAPVALPPRRRIR